MTTGPGTPQELSQDLVLAMRHLEPLLRAMLSLMQDREAAAETKVDALVAVMDRIATALEATRTHLAPLGRRMDGQEDGLNRLSVQMADLVHRLDRQDRGRAALEARIQDLLAVLTE